VHAGQEQTPNFMKILVSAYACEPGKGSEQGTGWNWVRQIAKQNQVWVLTRANNRKAIESALADEPLPNSHWVYFDLPAWMRFWKRGRWGVHAYYYLWQVGVFFVARNLQRRTNFDLSHHVTLVTYWMPSLLPLLSPPFVWGPVGGGDSSPRGFFWRMGWRGKTAEMLRNFVQKLAHVDPFVRLTARRAAIALAATPATKRRLEGVGCKRIELSPDLGLSSQEIVRLKSSPMRAGCPFRLVSVGSLVHWKAFDLGLLAFAQFAARFPVSEYWLIGDGPERKKLERIARDFGVEQHVTFWGGLPRTRTLEKLAECDVLAHPSLHDSGSWACLEAMAAGRPVVCVDRGGPATLVTEDTGIKVQAESPEQTVRDLAHAFVTLASDPVLRARLGMAAAQRVEQQFAWGKRMESVMEIYRAVAPAARSGT